VYHSRYNSIEASTVPKPSAIERGGGGRHGRPFQVVTALVLGAVLGAACTSVELPLKYAKKGADVIFRGTIREYRDTGKGYKIAVFQVSRVWRGRVGQVVEMSTYPGYSDAPCAYFSTKLLEFGSDELVFARKVRGQDYLTSYWSGTRSAEYYPYLRELGPGTPPSGSN
jgi:hypothetical protein